MRNFLLSLAFLLPLFLSAQEVSTVTGVVEQEATTEPAAKATIRFVKGNEVFTTTTSDEGKFAIDLLQQGEYTYELVIGEKAYPLGKVNVNTRLINVGIVFYKVEESEDDRQNLDNIPASSSSETDVRDAGGQFVSSALNAARDPFVSTATFVFSNARFRIRGYDFENFVTYMNGLPVNDLEDGGTVWAQWGGLNNVMWNRDNTVGLTPTTFTFGAVGGAFALDSRASKQRRQLQVSYANTNRTFRHRLMATYSTGILKGGWAVSVSLSRRWAEEGYVAGTFYDGYSYFLSVEKIFKNKHSLSFTSFGAPTKTGRTTSSVQEMYNLAGSNYYNPLWGYQNGKKRNSSVANSHQPYFILNHDWKINEKSSLETAAGFSFGKRSVSAIDWNNAPDPRPDYYRYLPSFIEDSTIKAVAEKELRENEAQRQINWDKLYEANAMSFETIDSVDGIPGNTVSGKRARYIVEDRVQDTKKFLLASTYNTSFNDKISLSAGLTYQWQMTHNYKEVKDLLGADFYVDVNQFALRDFPDSFSVAQNDLNRPNRVLREGDRWGYDYISQVHRAGLWATPYFRFNKVDFFVSTELSYSTFWRNGKVVNGLFPDNSFGRSAIQRFFNYAFKAGVTYKVNGRNYLFLNGTYLTRAPFFDNSFVSPRTRNDVASNLQSEEIFGGEIGYRHVAPKLKVKADFFFTQFNNQTKTVNFFHDDLRTLVNYTLTGINTRHWGFEAGIEGKIYKGFSATGVLSIGRYTYSSRPTAIITQDNSADVRNTETVYAKGLNVAGTPQLAGSIGLTYRDPKFWFVNLYFNYYDWMWLDFNPARRTLAGIDAVEPNSDLYNNILKQQRLNGQFTMDMFIGYSWLLNNQFKNLKKRYFLVFNLGVSNITNNRSFVTGGFEQLRFDFFNKNPNRFPPRYFYAFGTTYFLNVAFRMQ